MFATDEPKQLSEERKDEGGRLPVASGGLGTAVAVVTAVTAVAASLMLAAQPAWAAPPANDSFSTAATLSGDLPITIAGSTVDATKEAGEPNHAGIAGGHSVWFRWTAASTGPVLIETCESAFDTLLAVYRGDEIDQLTTIASNDDSCGTRSAVRFTASAGETYQIAVDGFGSRTGTFVLKIEHAAGNDQFADAEVLSGLPALATVSPRMAGAEPGEPDHAGRSASASVWYRWTAETSGAVVAETCDSDFDTRLAVYTGESLASLSPVAENDTGCGPGAIVGPRSFVVFAATAGTTYNIAVDADEPVYTVVLRLRAAAVPVNDAFATASVLDGPLPVSITTGNFDATREAREPSHAGEPGGGSLWYRWTAPVSDRVTIDMCDSRFDTLVAVYTGTRLGTLRQEAANDDGCGRAGGPSRVRFAAVAGETYSIAVDGFAGLRDAVVLNLRHPPANDAFASAESLGGDLPINVKGTIVDATSEPPEFEFQHGSGSVWYTWTPTASTPTVIETCGKFDPVLAVFRGDELDALTEVATDRYATGWSCAGAPGNRVAFVPEPGTPYRIAVMSKFDDRGPFYLRVRPESPPANDAFAAATKIDGPLPLTIEGTNVDATREAGEPGHGGEGRASVWYEWTASEPGPVVADTCGSSFATLIGVYTGTAVDALTLVTTDNGSGTGCGDLRIARAHFDALAGTTYRIAVDGAGWHAGAARVGTVALTVRADETPDETPDGTPDEGGDPTTGEPPANDDFAAAALLDGPDPIAVAGTTIGGTAEPGEPTHTLAWDQPAMASVWYRWTAATSGVVEVETCGSDFDTLLAIYTGDDISSLTRAQSPDGRYTVDDDSCGLQSRVVLAAEEGQTYRIAVDGFDGATGALQLRLDAAESGDPPANDDFADAVTVSGPMPFTVVGTNVGATKEPWSRSIEPNHGFDSGGASVWYRWVATVSAPVEFSVCEADFPALVEVYAGRTQMTLSDMARSSADYGASVERAGHCDEGGFGNKLVIPAVAGEEYRIAVDGRGGETGSFRLRVSTPPTNDDIHKAQLIAGGGRPVNVFASNVDATAEPGEPDHAGRGGGVSLWYRWTPAATGNYVVQTCGSDIDTLLSVSTGNAINRLTTVVANDNACDTQSRVRLQATAHQTYWIAVDGAGRDTGGVRLQIRPDPGRPAA